MSTTLAILLTHLSNAKKENRDDVAFYFSLKAHERLQERNHVLRNVHEKFLML